MNKENKSPIKEASKSPGGKRKDWIPNYLSPYNKNLVTSDVPLKELITRTNKLNSKIVSSRTKAKKRRIANRADVENSKAHSVIDENCDSQMPLKRGNLTSRKSKNVEFRNKKKQSTTPGRSKNRITFHKKMAECYAKSRSRTPKSKKSSRMPLRNKSARKINHGKLMKFKQPRGARTPEMVKEDNIKLIMEGQKRKRRQ
jgi:hypothetical protein